MKTNGSGSIIATHKYGPFGEPINTSSSRFRYTGQILIPGTKLYHYKARVYNPKLDRFMQTDPIGYEDGMNWYAYVGHDPINATDPSGNFANFILGAIAGAIAETAVQAVEGKGFNLTKIGASATIGGITSGLSSMKLIADVGKITKAAVTTSFEATGPVSESIIHDSLDGNVANMGDALTSAVGAIPGVGNASTVSKIVKNEVAQKVGQKLASQEVGDLAGDFSAGVDGSAVKAAEAYAQKKEKQ